MDKGEQFYRSDHLYPEMEGLGNIAGASYGWRAGRCNSFVFFPFYFCEFIIKHDEIIN